jgi:hypothetical protein
MKQTKIKSKNTGILHFLHSGFSYLNEISKKIKKNSELSWPN